MKPFMLVLMVLTLSLLGCKKDENIESSGSSNNYSTTEFTLSFTLNEVVHEFVFGENGYGFQFDSFAFADGSNYQLSAATSYTWSGDPKTTNQGYLFFQLPTCVIPESEWENNSAEAFIQYFSEHYEYAVGSEAGLCTMSFTEADGNQWSSFLASQDGASSEWTEFLHVISAVSPVEVVNAGHATINLYNLVSDVTAPVEVQWNMKFMEPL